ncbi:STAS domain-containing protein [Streptomyces sp. NPDC056069]|uniref:STAS domain-containing protein n=1 Tax=Streptomyces sp. NPDC056069 TaxID=3345702 RepID=UPI0035DF9BF9
MGEGRHGHGPLGGAAIAAAHCGGEGARGAEIILDLQNSSFCDSTGLNELINGRQRALESGHPVSLAAPSHQMVRLLEITQAIGLFGLRPAVPPEQPAGTARG